MSNLRSAIEELQVEDLRYAGDEQLEDDFVELQRAADLLEAERARRLAEIDRRSSHYRDGYLSLSSWATHRCRMAFSAAMGLVRLARGLVNMPSTLRALRGGEISGSAAHVLLGAHEAHSEEFSRVEETLVEAARNLSVRDLRRAVAHWRQAVDHRRAEEDEERRFQLRRLYVSPTLDGMVRVDGNLDADTGQTLISALASVEDAQARSGDSEDRRTAAQRRADALGEICRQWLDHAGRPTVACERPHVNVNVDLEALAGNPNVEPCEFDDVSPILPETARRWACDASVTRIISLGRSEPLDVGRRTAVVSPALRRAVVFRDRGCRFPGCERPHRWCDAHHVIHWADGGPTALWNLILLCRRHHRLIHQGFRVEAVDGEFRFWRPDGSTLDERGPP